MDSLLHHIESPKTKYQNFRNMGLQFLTTLKRCLHKLDIKNQQQDGKYDYNLFEFILIKVAVRVMAPYQTATHRQIVMQNPIKVILWQFNCKIHFLVVWALSLELP